MSNKLQIGIGLQKDGTFDSVINGMKSQFNEMSKGISTMMSGAFQFGAATTSAGILVESVTRIDDAFSSLQDQLGVADSGLSDMREEVYQLNSALGLKSPIDAANMLRDVSRTSKLAGQELKDLTFQTGLLEKKFGDSEGALSAQVNMIRAWNVDAKAAGDSVAYLMNQGGDLRGELLDSINEYSVQFADAGFSLNQTVAAMQAGLNSGWSIDKAADAFKEGRLRLMGGDRAAVDALKILGLDNLTDQIKAGTTTIPQAFGQIQTEMAKLSNVEQFQIGKEIFGTQYEDTGAKAMTAMLEGMNSAVKSSGTIDLITKNMQDRIGWKWDNALSNMTNATAEMMTSLKPAILPAIEWFGEAAESVKDFSTDYKSLTKTIVLAGIGLLGITATVGLAKMVFGGLSTSLAITKMGFGGIKTGANGAKKAFGGLKNKIAMLKKISSIGLPALLKMGLWGGLAAGIAYAGYKLYEYEQETGNISKAWNELPGKIQKAKEGIIVEYDELTGGLRELWGGLGNSADKSFKELKEKVNNFIANPLVTIEGIKKDMLKEYGELTGGLTELWDGLGKSADNSFKNIKETIDKFITNPLKTAQGFMNWAAGKFDGIGQSFTYLFTGKDETKKGKDSVNQLKQRTDRAIEKNKMVSLAGNNTTSKKTTVNYNMGKVIVQGKSLKNNPNFLGIRQ